MANKKRVKSPVESFGDMVKEFGEVISKIFDDPGLKNKAREFAQSAEESAKTFGKRFRDEGVKEKFKDFKEAAGNFGDSVSDYFRNNKEKNDDLSQKEYEWERNLNEKMKDFGETTKEVGQGISKKAEKAGKKIENYFNQSGVARITGCSFSIVWSTVLLVFFNFYNSYIAYYHYDGQWHRVSLLTEDFNLWLPVVSVALAATIAGNILMIIYDSSILYQIIRIILNLFGIAALISLLTLFPFDFTVFPGGLDVILNPVVIAFLVIIIVGVGIDTVVRLIKLIVSSAKAS